MAKTERDKIYKYVSKVWPGNDIKDHEENVQELMDNNYTTLDAVKKIKSNEHLTLHGGKLPMRFRFLIKYNNQKA